MKESQNLKYLEHLITVLNNTPKDVISGDTIEYITVKLTITDSKLEVVCGEYKLVDLSIEYPRLIEEYYKAAYDMIMYNLVTAETGRVGYGPDGKEMIEYRIKDIV